MKIYKIKSKKELGEHPLGWSPGGCMNNLYDCIFTKKDVLEKSRNSWRVLLTCNEGRLKRCKTCPFSGPDKCAWTLYDYQFEEINLVAYLIEIRNQST